MFHILLYTLCMIAATFAIGLAVAWLMQITANLLYYFEHRSFIHDLKVYIKARKQPK